MFGKHFYGLGIFIAIISSLVFTTGCGMMGGSSAAHSSSLVTGTYDQINIPKYSEYEVLGLVFASTEEYVDIDRPYLTYLELLKKAEQLGGHAIVNVSIEESKNCEELKTAVRPYKKEEKACRIKRFGSALAIKYTKMILEGPLVEAEKQAEAAAAAPAEETSSKSSILPF